MTTSSTRTLRDQVERLSAQQAQHTCYGYIYEQKGLQRRERRGCSKRPDRPHRLRPDMVVRLGNILLKARLPKESKQTIAKKIHSAVGVDVHAVGAWLVSYGRQDSP